MDRRSGRSAEFRSAARDRRRVFQSGPLRTDRGALSRRAGRRSKTCSGPRTDSSRSTRSRCAPSGAACRAAPHANRSPMASAGHGRRIPFRVVVDPQVAGRPCWRREGPPTSSIFSASTCVSIPRAATRPRVENSASGPTPSVFSTSPTSSFTRGWPRDVRHQHARQRPDFHRLVVVARRLQPGILLVGVEMLVRGLGPV